MAIRAMALCVAAAAICTVVRQVRPELATVISLAAGVAVLGMLIWEIRTAMPSIQSMWSMVSSGDGGVRDAMLKAAGIAALAELGAQLCLDSGESALAGRITLVSRIAIIGLCLPLLMELMEKISDTL